jgi:L-alanine-DL-glutamate epimerase-like enolase superfamily enzyme
MAAMVSKPSLPAAASETSLLQLDTIVKSPVKIASVELVKSGGRYFVRSTSSDGAVGISLATERIGYLYPILQQLVIPYFKGKDARDVETLVDGVYVHSSNYKLAGLAFWCCVGWVEFSLFDLLGQVSKKSVGELLGGVIRNEIPVYMSSMRRDTTPEQEVEWVGKRMEETGAKACKLKIGGRMSKNADASPGRTDRLIPLARKTFGNSVAIHVDANGSYDSAKAIEVGKMLEANNVFFFEEPCPFEELEETKRVADGLTMSVAGGEQDASLPRFQWMIKNRVVDIVQPDLDYNGGFVRTLRVARMAAAAGMSITPHGPKVGAECAWLVHFASAMPNMGRFQEYNAAPHKAETWYEPSFEVKNGAIKVPTGPGLGIAFDPAMLSKAEPVQTVRI